MVLRPKAALAILIAFTVGFGAPASGEAPTDGSGVAAPSAPTAVALDLSGVSVSIDEPGPYQTALGLPLDVTVRAVVPAPLELVSLSVGGNSLIEVLDAGPLTEADGAFVQEFQLGVFRSGDFHSTGIELLLIDGNGEQHVVSSEPFTIEVESRIINESDPAPAPSDPPLVVLSRDMRPIYAGSALGFVGLGALIAAVARRRTREEDDELLEEIERRPAWELAFEALDALGSEGMLDDGRHLEFHMRLSEILREYIGARFSFLALEMTTTEIAAALTTQDAGEYRAELLDVLGDMDMVKFARFTPPRELSDACFESVRRVVTELSARERDAEALAATEASAPSGPDGEGNEVVESEPTESLPAPHAPSPDSTTTSFAEPPSTSAPENVVAFPTRLTPPSDDPTEDA